MSFNKANTFKVASKYVQQGRLPAAIEEYRKILQAEPSNTTVLNILGDLYVKVGNKVEAVNCFVSIADYYKQAGSISKAIATLKKASKVEPQSPEIALKLGALYARENLWGEARQQYLWAAEQYSQAGRIEEALSIYQRITEHDPEKAGVQIKLAEIYLRTYQPELAYQAFVSVGNEFQQQGRQEEALKVFLQALKAKPEGREALSSAINIYLQRAETLPAETLLKSLLKMRPEDPELPCLLRRVHQMAHDLKIAKHAISHAVEQDASRVQYQVDLVSASDRACATFLTAASEYQRQSKNEEALQSYLNALKIKPESRAAASAAVTIYLQQGDTQAATMLLRHLLRGRPDDTELLSLLAQVYHQAKDYDAAEQTIGRAIAINPERFQDVLDLASLLTLGGELNRALRLLDFVKDILPQRGEEEKAISLLQDAVARDANHLGALERLAEIYERLNDTSPLILTLTTLAHAAIFQDETTLATKALRRLVQLEPDEAWHQRLLQRVTGGETTHSALPPRPEEPRAGTVEGQGEEAQIVMFPPWPEVVLPVLNLLPRTEQPSQPRVEAEAHLVTPEEPVAFFPEYHHFEVASETTMLNAPRKAPPREGKANDGPVKGFSILPEPVVVKPVVSAAQRATVLDQPPVCVVPLTSPQPLAETVPPSAAPEPAVAEPRDQYEVAEPRQPQIEKIEALAPEMNAAPQPLPSQVALDDETTLASAAATPAGTQTMVINFGWWPTPAPITSVWRRMRPLSKKKEAPPPASPRRGRGRMRRRFPRR
jgi:tetratricopeptide (TPR) repeat protein